MKFTVGSLVSAREREWVVLPGTRDDLGVVTPWFTPVAVSGEVWPLSRNGQRSPVLAVFRGISFL